MNPRPLLQRLRQWLGRRQIDGPVFGTLRRRDQRVWDTRAPEEPFGPDVHLSVFAGIGGPHARQRELFTELRRRYPELRRQIEPALHREYCSIRARHREGYQRDGPNALTRFEHDFPAADAPQDIWKLATLYRIELSARPDVDVVFDHTIRWGDDHQLNVMVKDWRVIDVAMEG
jgi:hypothetical protein